MTATLICFGLYLATTVAIGLWAASRGEASEEDYFLAGRKLSGLSMALSAVSSGRSAWLVVGASAAAWSAGLSALWLFPGYVVAEALIFVTVGPRLRARSAAMGAITVPEVLAGLGTGGRRFPVRPVAGAVSSLFLLTYVSAQLGAGAKTLGGVFAIEGGTQGLLITAGIVAAYTLLGGYRAVVVTDVLQAGFMLVGMVVLPLLGLRAVGGFGALVEGLRALDPELVSPTRGWLAAVGGLAIGLGSFGNPHVLVRHMSLRDPGEARLAMVAGTFWNVVMAGGALLMGLVGRVLYPTTAAMVGDGREYLFATLTRDMSERYLFAGFAGVLLATLFAAVMSTCDSQLLVVASSFVRDFRGRAAGRGGIVASRVAVTVTLGLAVALSYGDVPLVNELVLLSWGALGAAFGPVLLLGLYDRRTRAAGVFWGVLAGAGTVVVLWWFHARVEGKAITYELIGGYLVAAGVVLAARVRGVGRAAP